MHFITSNLILCFLNFIFKLISTLSVEASELEQVNHFPIKYKATSSAYHKPILLDSFEEPINFQVNEEHF